MNNNQYSIFLLEKKTVNCVSKYSNFYFNLETEKLDCMTGHISYLAHISQVWSHSIPTCFTLTYSNTAMIVTHLNDKIRQTGNNNGHTGLWAL